MVYNPIWLFPWVHTRNSHTHAPSQSKEIQPHNMKRKPMPYASHQTPRWLTIKVQSFYQIQPKPNPFYRNPIVSKKVKIKDDAWRWSRRIFFYVRPLAEPYKVEGQLLHFLGDGIKKFESRNGHLDLILFTPPQLSFIFICPSTTFFPLSKEEIFQNT